MRHSIGSWRRGTPVLLVAALALVSCSVSRNDTAASTTEETPPATTARPPEEQVVDDFSDFPAEARAATGGGDPRPPAYWAVWNSCAPDNRAAEAAANGGRAAGWVLVDDVLADPGIQLGEHLLTSCEESVALLKGRTAEGRVTGDPAYGLAAQLLAAELNLNVGAETCPLADEAVLGAHLVLSSANFDGESATPLDAEAGGALPQLVDLLTAYNLGELCR